MLIDTVNVQRSDTLNVWTSHDIYKDTMDDETNLCM